MLDITDKRLLRYISDYKLNLLTPESIADNDFDKFQTEMKQLLKYIKYSKDRSRLDELVHQDPSYEAVSGEVATVIETVTHTKLNIKKGEKVVNVRNAIDEMKDFAKAEGRAEGKLEGFFDALAGLVKDGLLPLSVAAQRSNITVSEFEARAGLKA